MGCVGWEKIAKGQEGLQNTEMAYNWTVVVDPWGMFLPSPTMQNV